MLVEITPSDPVTFMAITILLTIVSVAACLCGRRATRDPIVALARNDAASGRSRGVARFFAALRRGRVSPRRFTC